MTRAALPLMRKTAKAGGTRAEAGTAEGERTGRIVNFSSVGGITGRMGVGLYNATKFAVEGLSEALATEVGEHGITVTIVEPGAFRTEFLGGSITVAKNKLPAYDKTSGVTRTFSTDNNGKQLGDPHRAIAVILQAVDAAEPPLRLPLGEDAYRRIREKLDKVHADMAAWEKVATKTAVES
jgi:NAD(P)-dependent dehydrogenase (short-subunit alcohol dehydrogenase family)